MDGLVKNSSKTLLNYAFVHHGEDVFHQYLGHLQNSGELCPKQRSFAVQEIQNLK
jgi:hypothetical protein